jgi:hypothetical protein
MVLPADKKREVIMMLWCLMKNMWCSDMNEEDRTSLCCDGQCKGCIFSEEVKEGEENEWD